jgi:hypothetical protein
MDHREATEGILKWKVANPRQSNHIVQMRSRGFQAPFFAGGNQVPSALGIKGNSITSTNSLPTSAYSTTEKMTKKNKK